MSFGGLLEIREAKEEEREEPMSVRKVAENKQQSTKVTRS
jgi:hypothetical protein